MQPPLAVIASPIRVRGKRGARPEEKWNFGRRRDPKLQQRRLGANTYGRQSTPSVSLEEPRSPSRAKPRKRRRRLVPPSPLEALPPEVLQTIFAYSANVMLPLTSTQLASKLCNSMHLRYHLSDCLLNPILGYTTARATDADLASATRLLNSRFMDFAFFKTWLLSKSQAKGSESTPPGDIDWRTLWSALQPSSGLLPPRKLFSAPFSNDKTSYLSVLGQAIGDITSLNSPYGELAYEVLLAAVKSDNVELSTILLGMGVTATTDVLRAAIIDATCDEELVQLLLRSASPEDQARRGHVDGIDLLDPIIWSWAEKARENGNAKGNWLMDLLRERQELYAALD